LGFVKKITQSGLQTGWCGGKFGEKCDKRSKACSSGSAFAIFKEMVIGDVNLATAL
jgi:hypothetical protein